MADSGRGIFDGGCYVCGAHFGEECRDGSECDPAVHEARHAAELDTLRARAERAEQALAAEREAARKDPDLHEAVQQLGVRDPAGGPELRVDARRSEARDRVQLVDDDLARALWGGVDALVGGFPCQDVSCAGKGVGVEKGTRSGLWREFARLIRCLRPRWVVAENVPALRTRGADLVVSDLEAAGYTVWPCVVGAHHVGAPHRRDRPAVRPPRLPRPAGRVARGPRVHAAHRVHHTCTRCRPHGRHGPGAAAGPGGRAGRPLRHARRRAVSAVAEQMDLLALLDEQTRGRCWRCRHNVAGRCWCDLPIPYPPGEPLHDGDAAVCWCDEVPEAEVESSWAWADAWVLAHGGAA